MTARLSVYHGAVTLREVRLSKEHAKHVSARVEREPLALSSQTVRGCVKVKFKRALQLREGQSLEVRII
jgi:predicted lipid carrier protein YhbT